MKKLLFTIAIVLSYVSVAWAPPPGAVVVREGDNIGPANVNYGLIIGALTAANAPFRVDTGGIIHMEDGASIYASGGVPGFAASGDSWAAFGSGGGGTTYNAGNGLDLAGTTFSADNAVLHFDSEASAHAGSVSVHHVATVSGDITHDSTSGGTTDDAHFDHADDLAELNTQISSGLVTGAHTVAGDLDHGGFNGLSDDDHPIYATTTELLSDHAGSSSAHHVQGAGGDGFTIAGVNLTGTGDTVDVDDAPSFAGSVTTPALVNPLDSTDIISWFNSNGLDIYEEDSNDATRYGYLSIISDSAQITGDFYSWDGSSKAGIDLNGTLGTLTLNATNTVLSNAPIDMNAYGFTDTGPITGATTGSFSETVSAPNFVSTASTHALNVNNSSAPTGTFLGVGDIYTLDGQPYVAVDGTVKSAFYTEENLIFGTNLTLTGNTLDATGGGTTYSAGLGLALVGTEFSFDGTLDEVNDPANDASFTFGNNSILFKFDGPTSNGFEIDITGAFTGDGLHIHQHDGNPTPEHLVHIEAEDADISPLVVISEGSLPAAAFSGGIQIDGELYSDHIGSSSYHHAQGIEINSVVIAGASLTVDTYRLEKEQVAITLTDIHCITDTGTVIIELMEQDSAGANDATVDAPITCDSNGTEDDGSLTNGTIDAADWLAARIGTEASSPTQVNITWYYTVD